MPSPRGYVELDVGLLTLGDTNFPSGMGQGRWMGMSSITSAISLESLTAVSLGSPGTGPNATPNLYYNGTFVYFFKNYSFVSSDLYKTFGAVSSPTSSAFLATKLESGGGQSGSGIFYYTDDATSYTGQGHYIIGVLSGSMANNSGSTGDDYTVGATVGQFKSWVTGQL